MELVYEMIEMITDFANSCQKRTLTDKVSNEVLDEAMAMPMLRTYFLTLQLNRTINRLVTNSYVWRKERH